MHHRRRSFHAVAFSLLLLCGACKTTERRPHAPLADCSAQVQKLNWSEPIETLNRISDLYRQRCYNDTISFANEAKARFGHKTFSFSKEALEFFSAEGTFTDYVLESYERGYLSFLIAASYVQLGRSKDAPVELNKFYNEERALTYNHGQDPVNALIQAAMWDNVQMEGFSSRPFWQWLANDQSIDQTVRAFAKKWLKQIDKKQPTVTWQLWEIGSFPHLQWSTRFSSSQRNSYFDIKPSTRFPKTCSNTDGVLVLPTTSWLNKIASRHEHSYHPLVHIKSWVRLPFGLIYGLSTIAAGTGIMAGGCALDIGIKASGDICRVSIESGAAVMGESVNAVNYTIKPDLRHWEHLPEAIMIAPVDQVPAKDCDDQKTDHSDFRIL